MDPLSVSMVLYGLMMIVTGQRAQHYPILGVDTISSPTPPPIDAPLGKVGQTWVREEECRSILQKIYGVPFPKCKGFMKSPRTRRPLELDGYNPNLKIAFEHNGAQHYEFPNTFHRDIDAFWRQKYNDKVKADRCRALGIRLVIIRYDDKNIEHTIRNQLAL